MKAFISSRILPEWLEKIAERFEVDQSHRFDKGNLSNEELIARMHDSHVAVIENDELPAEVLEQCPDLFAIVDFRGTVANIDIEAATRNGTVILNAPGRNADAVADFTVALMIDLLRHVVAGERAIREGLWVSKGARWAYVAHQGSDMPGKTVGLVGLGHIGRLVAERLRGFRVNLLGYDPYVSQEAAAALGIRLCELDELLEAADFVSLHLPHNAHTEGMIDEAALRRMKPSAYLVNTSRAEVVDGEALVRCMSEGWIAGAALDVFEDEPIGADHPLVQLPNVLCTPHLGGATTDVVANHCRIGVEGLLAFLDGTNPDNIVNPAAIEAARRKMSR
ncbi:MAG: NAD(P)-dependent oxidoreductase [Anaerolineaceae bacterium]|jgi:phosphoglycerate dehydrogenase-like enzyme|nr:NAD(P)-dependent oxidoreductase [Anaerolineaceae bacterium]